MIVIRLEKPFKGGQPGDVVRFAAKAEALSVIAEGYGKEVRWDDLTQSYVPVRRTSVSVTDGISARTS